jgi:glycosyltransferase involved in cell wall biosynthesis
MADIRKRRNQEHDFDILILGPLPPPLGGISVHVSRLAALLAAAGFRVGVLNHFSASDGPHAVGALKRNPLNYYRLPKKFPARIVHYHHSKWLHLVACAAGRPSADAKYFVTLHAGDIRNHFPQLISRAPLVSRITRWALGRFDVIISVDSKIAEILSEHCDGQQIEVVPAFLPWGADEHTTYDPFLEKFLNNGRGLVVAAYGVQFLSNGQEIYGLDTVIDAFIALADESADLWLAVFVARRPTQPRARRHLAGLEQRLRLAGVSERVRIVYGLPLVPALRPNVIFVRPTRAEGDAVSVREAQSAGIPVIASDVIGRPSGVRTFSAGSAQRLCDAIRPLLDQSAGASEAGSPSADHAYDTAEPFSEKLIRLYRTE